MRFDQAPNTSSAAAGADSGGGEAVNMEVMAPSAAMAMERAAVDNQVATAKAYPRSMAQFRKKALDMVSLDPETADSCNYVRPVGKKKDEKTGEWKMEYAEGPSIRAAEIVAAAYTNLRFKSVVVEQTERYVRVEGQAWDMENNVAASVQRVETTVKKDGTPYTESHRNVVALAALAKVQRDAIFKVVPRALFKPVMEHAKEVAKKHVPALSERLKRVQAWVSTLKVDEKRVFAALNVQGWADMGEEHLSTITGLRTSMKEENIPVDEVFPPIVGQTLPTPPTPRETKGKEKAPEKTPEKAPAVAKDKPEPEKGPETPAKPDEPAGTPEPAKEEAKQEPAPEAKPNPILAEPVPTDPKELVNYIEAAVGAAGLKYEQLIAFLRKTQLMRANQQKLNDLASKKLTDIANSLKNTLPEIAKM